MTTSDHSASPTCATAVAVWANTRWAQGATVAPVSALLDTLGIPRGATVEDLQRRLAITERVLTEQEAIDALIEGDRMAGLVSSIAQSDRRLLHDTVEELQRRLAIAERVLTVQEAIDALIEGDRMAGLVPSSIAQSDRRLLHDLVNGGGALTSAADPRMNGYDQ